jgi:hypothetical protein
MSQSSKPAASLLERLTGLVLILVLLAIGWMVLVTLVPGLPRVVSLKAEVIVMIVLLTAALALVSIVALVHTRK